ncbi:Alpha/Beta hydrolase protein [Aspergillus pseudoustus]|uniref:Alpha/Beta hydrolase protein n=1 Tax=Aspergillus pseudoustus TaxID=1810923 RepID=A0ABR4JEA8_9EURO
MSEIATTTIPLASGPILALTDPASKTLHARGIPYAIAPRFAPPQPISAWTAGKDCTVPAPICPQLPSRLESVMGPLTAGHEQSESCLTLSVTAPLHYPPHEAPCNNNNNNSALLPVLVWFHGGAYISGGGDLACYQPLKLAEQGVVCVTVTYRLGVFGYLGLAGIAPRNLGLLDQREALLWVRSNISAFGGDPGNVTAVGQSAGADSIICLLAAEGAKSKELFAKAILLSPPLREIRERAVELTAELLTTKAEGLLTRDPREMDVSELLDLQKKLLMDPVRKQVMLFAPALGEYPLPAVEEFDKRIAGAVADIPILIGWTAHDGRPFSSMMDPFGLGSWGFYNIPLLGSVAEAAQTWYVTRSYFSWPSQEFHAYVRKFAGRSTTYEFGWAAERSKLGSCHCVDIPFVLGAEGAWDAAPMLWGSGTEGDLQRLGEGIRGLWVGFMRGEWVQKEHLRFV